MLAIVLDDLIGLLVARFVRDAHTLDTWLSLDVDPFIHDVVIEMASVGKGTKGAFLSYIRHYRPWRFELMLLLG